MLDHLKVEANTNVQDPQRQEFNRGPRRDRA